MKRLLLAGSAALALTLGASACGSVDPNAAVVNGVAIKARHVEADVAALVKLNAAEGTAPSVRLPGEGVRQILAFEVLATMLETDPANPTTVDQAAIDAASADLGGANGFGEKWQTAPADVRLRLSRAAAITQAAQNAAGGADAYNQRVTELLRTTPVKINARYGSWDITNAAVTPNLPVTTTR